MHGCGRAIDKSGFIKEGQFKHGLIHGFMRSYNADGNSFLDRQYNEGEEKSWKIFDLQGKLIG